jgi:hypothetical protein
MGSGNPYIYVKNNSIIKFDIAGLIDQTCECTESIINDWLAKYNSAYSKWLLRGGFHVGNTAEVINWGKSAVSNNCNYCGSWADQLATFMSQEVGPNACCSASAKDYPQPGYGGTTAHVAVAVSCKLNKGQWFDPYNWPWSTILPGWYWQHPIP